MKRNVIFLIELILLFFSIGTYAQQYTGMTGLIHVPSADMDEAGTARIGAHFLNKKFTPDAFNYGGKYNTADYYLSLTPFSWIELAYTCTLQKNAKRDGSGNIVGKETRYYYQDRYFSVKLQPLKEDKWWPSIAIGSNDPIGTLGSDGTVHDEESPKNSDGKSQYFCNYYVAVTKHLDLKDNSIGFHLAYRKYKRSYNSKWNGPVGGITFQPSFQKNLRLIAEYTGNEVNVGFDWKLWKHLLIQSSLQNGKYFSGGVCYQLNLL